MGSNGINKQGNKRGTASASLNALARGREAARRKQGPRGTVVGMRTSCAGLKGKAGKVVASRIKKHIAALDEEPNLLGSIVAATMVADMEDANRFLENGWNAVHTFLENDDAELPEGISPEKAAAYAATGKAGRAILVLPLIEELRRWSKLTAELALRVAEIHARTRGPESPDDYLRNRYGDDGGKTPEPAKAIPDGTAPITIDDVSDVDDG